MLQSDRKPSFHDAGSKGMAGYSEDSQMTLDGGVQSAISLSENWIEGLFM